MLRTTLRYARRVALGAVLAGVAGAGAGCYERVVSAKGMGASSMTVYQANVPSEQPSNDRAITTPLGRSN